MKVLIMGVHRTIGKKVAAHYSEEHEVIITGRSKVEILGYWRVGILAWWHKSILVIVLFFLW